VGTGVGVTATTGKDGGVRVSTPAGGFRGGVAAAAGVSTAGASAGDEVVAESGLVDTVSSVAGTSVDVRGVGS
jgi:hypothetical protein